MTGRYCQRCGLVIPVSTTELYKAGTVPELVCGACGATHDALGVLLPGNGRIVIMTLSDGSEAPGWYDRSCGWYRCGTDRSPITVTGWRERLVVEPVPTTRRFDLAM